MRRIAQVTALLLGVSPGPALAQDWQALSGDQVRVALEGRKLTYDSGATQDFRASGRTLYNAGRDSWGYWRITGDQYCSQWPPSDLWSCYDLLLAPDGARVRFVGGSGETSDATYVPTGP
jgi:hypothetical protein